MTAKKFTDEQKQAAVLHYLEEGATSAAATIGCTRQAIYKWLGEYGVVTVNGEEKRASTIERHTQKRLALAEVFLDQSMTMALAANPAEPLDAQRLMTTAAIASQKFIEIVGPNDGKPAPITLDWINQEVARLEGELANVAPDDRSSDIDKSVGVTFKEWERKLRSEIRADIEAERAPLVTPHRLQDVANTLDELGMLPNGHHPPEDVS